MKPIQSKKILKSSIYNISENIVRILNSPKDSKHLTWIPDFKRAKDAPISELYHSEEFKKHYLFCKQDGKNPTTSYLGTIRARSPMVGWIRSTKKQEPSRSPHIHSQWCIACTNVRDFPLLGQIPRSPFQ
jgi:hypothetical protein